MRGRSDAGEGDREASTIQNRRQPLGGSATDSRNSPAPMRTKGVSMSPLSSDLYLEPSVTEMSPTKDHDTPLRTRGQESNKPEGKTSIYALAPRLSPSSLFLSCSSLPNLPRVLSDFNDRPEIRDIRLQEPARGCHHSGSRGFRPPHYEGPAKPSPPTKREEVMS